MKMSQAMELLGYGALSGGSELIQREQQEEVKDRICKKYGCELYQWEEFKALEEKEAQSATTVSGQMEQI